MIDKFISNPKETETVHNETTPSSSNLEDKTADTASNPRKVMNLIGAVVDAFADTSEKKLLRFFEMEESGDTCETADAPFAETHTPMTTAVHNRLKSYALPMYLPLPYSECDGKAFSSRSECISALTEILCKAYDKANAYFTPDSDLCLAHNTTEFYSSTIEHCFAPLWDELEKVSKERNRPHSYRQLEELVDHCRTYFTEEFNAELRREREFYQMYSFDYFWEKVTIEKHDYSIYEDYSLLHLLEYVVSGTIEYSFSESNDAIREMEDDLNRNAKSYFDSCYTTYTHYVEQIESLVQALTKEVSASDEVEFKVIDCNITLVCKTKDGEEVVGSNSFDTTVKNILQMRGIALEDLEQCNIEIKNYEVTKSILSHLMICDIGNPENYVIAEDIMALEGDIDYYATLPLKELTDVLATVQMNRHLEALLESRKTETVARFV